MNQPQTDRDFAALLDYLKYNRGCDLTGYKHSTLLRRFAHRMHSIGVKSYQVYLQYLQSHSEEYLALLNDVLINVTCFFRDRDAWEYLASDIVPKIIANKQPDESIRVWSAACASGQEVYSLVMLFAEALGIESCLQRVQFYATDIDKAAIKQARLATYSATEVAEIPSHLREKYFEQTPQGYVFHHKLRRLVAIGNHNLAEDAPMSKIDLLACRNALMYFNPETQASILVRFHFALKDSGFLFLGKAESLATRRQIFTPVNLKQQIYTKGLDLELRDHLLVTPRSGKKQALNTVANQSRIWQTAYETSPVAQLAVSLNDRLVMVNMQANVLFKLTLDDWQRSFKELEAGKLVGKCAAMKSLYRDRRPVTFKNVEWIVADGIKYLDMTIAPIFNHNKHLLGVNLTFIDVSDRISQAAELEDTIAELSKVSETLEQTQAALESTCVELECTQHELASVYQKTQFSNS